MTWSGSDHLSRVDSGVGAPISGGVSSHTQSRLHRDQNCAGPGAAPENAYREHPYNPGQAAGVGCIRPDRMGHIPQHSHLH
jgi:hypothetical protein